MTAAGIRSYMQIFSRFGLTWHRKVNFSTFSGKLTFQSTRNGPQNLPFCPGPLQDTFIIFSSISHQHIFRKYFSKKSKTENPKRRAPENDRDLSFQKLIWSHMGTHGLSMDYPWIIHGLSMDNPWASMDFQGLGEPASPSRGNRCPAQRYTISLPNC